MVFQGNAFQNNALQIPRSGSSVNTDSTGTFPDYYGARLSQMRQHERKIIEERAELKRVDTEITEAERKRKEQELAAEKAKVKKNAAKKLAALQAQLVEEINLLRLQRTELIQRINEEEGALIVLMAMKRRRFRVV